MIEQIKEITYRNFSLFICFFMILLLFTGCKQNNEIEITKHTIVYQTVETEGAVTQQTKYTVKYQDINNSQYITKLIREINYKNELIQEDEKLAIPELKKTFKKEYGDIDGVLVDFVERNDGFVFVLETDLDKVSLEDFPYQIYNLNKKDFTENKKLKLKTITNMLKESKFSILSENY